MKFSLELLQSHASGDEWNSALLYSDLWNIRFDGTQKIVYLTMSLLYTLK